ncbi:MAG: hypothetical protein HY741_21875 [Chloroflexi bacterium]|nr:hypothetical protein [Chloroflexota bacterium]
MAERGALFSIAQTRWLCIPLVTTVGALWLHLRGPIPVMSGTTPLPGTVPWWYILAAFPVLGMLLADWLWLLIKTRWSAATIELGIQIALLLVLSSWRLKSGILLSGHTLLFAYVVVRRLLVPFPDRTTRRFDLVVTVLLLCLTGYVKIAWWDDSATLIGGVVIGALLGLASGAGLHATKALARLPLLG